VLALVWNSGTSRAVVPLEDWWEWEYAEVESWRREYQMRCTGADWGVVVMKGL
jgi:hypothetical protein